MKTTEGREGKINDQGILKNKKRPWLSEQTIYIFLLRKLLVHYNIL
jgi:hypothetical protein